MEKTADRLGANRADRDEQEQRIGERREDRSLLQTISEPGRRRAPGHHRSRPGNNEPEHIRQIVAGVGQQRHRVGEEAVDCLDRKKAEVERDSDGERSAEIARRMRMAVRVYVGVAVRMVGHAHDLADASAEIQMRFVKRPSGSSAVRLAIMYYRSFCLSKKS